MDSLLGLGRRKRQQRQDQRKNPFHAFSSVPFGRKRDFYAENITLVQPKRPP
jgi:hypothetical protein